MTVTISELKEMNNECHEQNCSDYPTHKVYWPGQPERRYCYFHAQKAIITALTIGFHLQVEEI